ncbi:MAG: hypothetical protein IT370_25130 [Deltaproteobacteria bacterium]|nr:hypothetical protein [Deltaproteobacteria bacterium]
MRRLLPLTSKVVTAAVLVLALSSCGESTPPRIGSVTMAVSGDRVAIAIRVDNPGALPLHVYAEPERILYDQDTRTLRLVMHQTLRDADLTGVATSSADLHFSQLRSITVPAGLAAVVHVDLAATLNHLVFPGSTGKVTFEGWPIHQARQVDIELGWSDTPLAISDGHGKSASDLRRELLTLERGVLTATLTR